LIVFHVYVFVCDASIIQKRFSALQKPHHVVE
jgi:hypothetical protein